MSKQKILDSVPENLRPQLIEEVKEILAAQEEKEKEEKEKVDDLVTNIMHDIK